MGDDDIPDYCFSVPLKQGFIKPECLVSGKDGEIISSEGAVPDREKFEEMRNEYYQLRGWDVAMGVQTKEQLGRLGLEDITRDLEQRGLIK